jgi:hypothetical protein
MARTERVIFLPYARGKRGAITPGVPVPCRNQAEAQRRAEKAMAGGGIIGAHVVRVTADEEAGDYGEPAYLATYGIVPEFA